MRYLDITCMKLTDVVVARGETFIADTVVNSEYINIRAPTENNGVYAARILFT